MSIKGGGILRDLIFDEKKLVITPLLDPELQLQEGSASVDLRLGTRFIASRRGSLSDIDPFRFVFEENSRNEATTLQDTHYVSIGDKFVLHPGHFVLGSTLEYLRLPSTLAGNVVTRSSWGRYGLIIATAVAIQPGFAGVLTLELRNLAEVPLILYPGTRMLQVFFYDVEQKNPDAFDQSSYLGSTGPSVGTFGSEKREMEIIHKFPEE